MARRVSWTNNSSGHSGTYVYRAPTLDPQALPAPVATVGPVAQGATAEWVDNSGEYGCFAVQDFDGGGAGALSAEVCVSDPWASVQVGDAIGGGIYGGTHTNGTETWHLIFAKQGGEADNIQWGNYGTVTGADDPDDGLANQNLVLANFDDGSADAFYHCRDYVDSAGNSDYYLPARNEVANVDALVSMLHPEFATALTTLRWSSTEGSSHSAWLRRFSDGAENAGNYYKGTANYRVRPVRRVPV